LDGDAFGCDRTFLRNRRRRRSLRGGRAKLQVYIRGLLETRVNAGLRFRSAVGRGRDLGGEVEIISGLKIGETVVVDGAFLLKAQVERSQGGEHED